MTTYIHLGGGGGSSGGGGSAYWADPVASFAALPGTDTAGTVRVTTDTGIVYWWDGGVWEPLDAEVATPAVTDSDSVDHTVTGGVLSSAVRLSADAATAGFFKATVTIKSGGSPGVHVEAPEASGSQTGFLTPANWTTFNAKEPAISSGTTDQFWRGDKSFQELNIAALVAVTDGSAASSGDIGQVITAQQASATASNVAASTDWGYATSISLTAGSWLVFGVVAFDANGATLEEGLRAAISDSATGVSITDLDMVTHNHLVTDSADLSTTVPMAIINISSTTTYYLNTQFVYSAGSPMHYGRLRALRIR